MLQKIIYCFNVYVTNSKFDEMNCMPLQNVIQVTYAQLLRFNFGLLASAGF